MLVKLFSDRGVHIDRHTIEHRRNLIFSIFSRDRLVTKKISKQRLSVMLHSPCLGGIHIGPSDYVPWQKDNKVCFMRIEGGFLVMSYEYGVESICEDSPNSAACNIDAIRCCKVARDRG
jgi:myo-inositol-1-phosphate synthase